MSDFFDCVAEHARPVLTINGPEIDVDEMLRLERTVPSYEFDAAMIAQLIDRWVSEILEPLKPEDQPHRESIIRHLGGMFLFDCGRIYGIRHERARRKRTARQNQK